MFHGFGSAQQVMNLKIIVVSKTQLIMKGNYLNFLVYVDVSAFVFLVNL